MTVRSIIVRVAIAVLVVASTATAVFLITRPSSPQTMPHCTASQMPAAPQYKQVVDPTTGLMPKSSNPDDYVAMPEDFIKQGIVIGDKSFKQFLSECGTNYSVKDTSVYVDQASYNYIIQVTGLNDSYHEGVYLSEAAAKSLGLKVQVLHLENPTQRITQQYVLQPTK